MRTHRSGVDDRQNSSLSTRGDGVEGYINHAMRPGGHQGSAIVGLRERPNGADVVHGKWSASAVGED